jgi:serine/threonine protein kinase
MIKFVVMISTRILFLLCADLTSIMPKESFMFNYVDTIQSLMDGKGFIFKEFLGEGNFGEIYKVKKNNSLFALKMVIHRADVNLNRIYKGMKIQRELSNKNKFIVRPRHIGFLNLDHLKNRTLSRRLGKGRFCFSLMRLAISDLKKPIKEMLKIESKVEIAKLLLPFFKNIVDGIIEINDKRFVHGDMKPDNILIFRDQHGEYVAQINDFDLVTKISESEEICSEMLTKEQDMVIKTIKSIIEMNFGKLAKQIIEEDLQQEIEKFEDIMIDFETRHQEKINSICRMIII